MTKPVKILDANTIIEYYGQVDDAPLGTPNILAGNAKMSELAEHYNIVVTSTVLEEIGGQQVPAHKKIPYTWFNQNADVVNTSAYDLLETSGKGERSIQSIVDSGYVDSEINTSYYKPNYNFNDHNVEVVSRNVNDFSGDLKSKVITNNELIVDQLAQSGFTDTEILSDGRMRIGTYIFDSAKDFVGKGIEVGGRILTPIGIILVLDAASNQAQAGDYDGAIDTLVSFGLGELAGGVAGAGVAVLAAQLLANTPHPFVKTLGIILSGLLAAYAAGEGTESAYIKAIEGLRDLGVVPEDLFNDLADGKLPANQLPDLPSDGVVGRLPSPWMDDLLQDWGDSKKVISPLVLDLDGNGIELASARSSGAVYWDIDEDGFAEASAWISGNDGLLAIDLNGDGIVNDHSELFGSSVTDGFSILSTYDTNSDGVIDINDGQFGSLLVWVDENSNGYSEGSELYALSTLGITSINLNASLVDYEIEGNRITHESTFTINGQERLIVDAWFVYDNINSRYIGDYTLDVRTLFLPTLRGFGDIKDLHIAMSMDNVLLEMVEDISIKKGDSLFNSSFNFHQKIIDVMYRWAGVDNIDPTSRGAYIDARKLVFMEKYFGDNFIQGSSSDPLGPNSANILNKIFNELYSNISTGFLLQHNSIATLNASGRYDIYAGNVVDGAIDHIQFLNPQTQSLSPSSADNLYIIESDYSLNFTLIEKGGFDQLWISGISAEELKFEYHYASSNLNIFTGSNIITIHDQFLSDYSGNNSYDHFQIERLLLDDGTEIDLLNNLTFTGTSGADTMYGLKTSGVTFIGGVGNDVLRGFAGNDTYIWSIGDGNDTINEVQGGGADTLVLRGVTASQIRLEHVYQGRDLKVNIGSESIYISDHFLSDYNKNNASDHFQIERLLLDDGTEIDLLNNLTFTGTSGADTMHGLNNANVTFVGGAGADILRGGKGNDTYIWSIGDGNDTINEVQGGGTDTLVLRGVTASQIRLEHVYQGRDLKVNIGSESIYISDHFLSDYNKNNASDHFQIERLLLDDGTEIDLLNNLTFTGTSGADTMHGLNNANVTFVGGAGADILRGGKGNDTYIWSIGDGDDNINEDQGGGIDTLVLHGVTASQIRFENSYTSTHLKIYIGSETLYISSQFRSDYYGSNSHDHFQIERLVLDDGTEIDLLNNLTFTGTSGANTIHGLNTKNDILYGLEGNDTLYGYGGDDVLQGGAGADILRGGKGNDTYIWSIGDGDDNINEDQGGGIDTLVLHGVTASQIRFENSYTSTHLKIYIGSETLYISSQFRSDYYGSDAHDHFQIERLVLDDGSEIDLLNNLTFTGTSGADTIHGLNTKNDILYGLEGNDTLYGYGGDDVLHGGIGNDVLIGGNGNDFLHGGAGTDTLTGGAGADTFVFSADAAFLGIDTISDFTVAQNDKIDISDLLDQYDPLSDALSDFVRITQSGSHSILSVDVDGGANNFVHIATLNNTSGLTDVQALYSAETLIV